MKLESLNMNTKIIAKSPLKLTRCERLTNQNDQNLQSKIKLETNFDKKQSQVKN
jgi:hypothetical protein